MSRGTAWYQSGRGGFPRVSGDEPQLADRGVPIWKFSPRERG